MARANGKAKNRSKTQPPRLSVSQSNTTSATKKASKIPVIYDSVPKKAHPILSGYFGYCLSKSMMKLKEDLTIEFGKLGIMPPQGAILDILSTSGPLNQLALGEEMGVDKASMVGLIDGLEKLELVERKTDAKDRRAKSIEITTKGKKLLPKLKVIRCNVETRYLAPLTKDEAEIYKNLTRKIFLSRFV